MNKILKYVNKTRTLYFLLNCICIADSIIQYWWTTTSPTNEVLALRLPWIDVFGKHPQGITDKEMGPLKAERWVDPKLLRWLERKLWSYILKAPWLTLIITNYSGLIWSPTQSQIHKFRNPYKSFWCQILGQSTQWVISPEAADNDSWVEASGRPEDDLSTFVLKWAIDQEQLH